jgi:hypothetical protein
VVVVSIAIRKSELLALFHPAEGKLARKFLKGQIRWLPPIEDRLNVTKLSRSPSKND